MVTVDFFRNVEFFAGFDDDAVSAIAAEARSTTYHRGDTIFAESDPAEDLFIVASGRIAISNKSPEGRESVLALMGPGDLFGDMALFDGNGRSAGARALETSDVVSVPYTVLRARMENDPKALWAMIALLTRRLRADNEALADSVFLDVTGRTAKRLLDIAGDADEFQLPITQEELAGMIGASRERVNKAIAAFIRLGWLEQHERTYRIVDRRRLANRAS